LIVRLSGQINRNDFGFDGFKSYVGDILKLAITVQIEKQ
jgi:polyisoprenoid-binding protein YceI